MVLSFRDLLFSLDLTITALQSDFGIKGALLALMSVFEWGMSIQRTRYFQNVHILYC